ncbi:MAG: cyanophycinase [Woeseiaceae bacterium]
MSRRFATIVCLIGLAPVAAADDAIGATGFQHYLTGNPADVNRPTSGLWVLQGGGDDVDENYVRMGTRAGGGDFVVLRASGADEYNDYIFARCHCDSVATIVFSDRKAASDPFVIDTIRQAEALFIAGGDQSRYVRYLKDTPVEDAINFVAAKPAPVGGTSAGMAILGEFVYSAMSPESLTSEVALRDPFAPHVTLERDFLKLSRLEDVLTDQHLRERNRIGRTVALLARLMRDGLAEQPRAIAADRETSLHVSPADGTAEVFTTADHPTPYVYFLRPSRPPDRCEPQSPLTFLDIDVYRLGPGGQFNLLSWQGTGGIVYRLSAEAGLLRSSRGQIY